ncbi:MAG: GntR family transcriptional regulator [Vulcanimicrobiaceae bacterium]
MNELFLAVDPELGSAPFQQIIDQVQAFIERGDLLAGDPLPTVRQLAGDLGVAPNTVARAYSELQDAGWLTSAGRRGTHVASHAPSNDKRTRTRLLQETVANFITTLTHRGYSKDEVAIVLQRFVK